MKKCFLIFISFILILAYIDLVSSCHKLDKAIEKAFALETTSDITLKQHK